MKHKKVVVIGHGFTSRLAVIRSVAQMGCEITVIVMTWPRKEGGELNIDKPIDCYSKYVKRVFYCHAKDHEGLINILLKECVDVEQKVIIFPDNDVSAAVIDINQDRLREHFLFPHINYEAGKVVEWMNKDKQKDLARTVGLNVPNSCVITVDKHNYTIPDGIVYPCFAKPLVTLTGGKYGVGRCNNEVELRDRLDAMGNHDDNIQVLVEDYKTIETEYSISGFSDGNDVIIPGVLKTLAMAHGSHFGVTCQGLVMPSDGYESLINKLKEFVTIVGYTGVFDIDFYTSEGKYYFAEMNLRIGGSCYAVTKMGVNLPGMYIKYISDESISDMQKVIKGCATYVNERMCLADWYHYYITTEHYHSMVNDSDISFVRDKTDKMPNIVFLKEYYVKWLKFKVKEILNRNQSYKGA